MKMKKLRLVLNVDIGVLEERPEVGNADALRAEVGNEIPLRADIRNEIGNSARAAAEDEMWLEPILTIQN